MLNFKKTIILSLFVAFGFPLQEALIGRPANNPSPNPLNIKFQHKVDKHRAYNHKMKQCKSAKDPVLKLHKLECLLTWCRINSLLKEIDKVTEEINKLKNIKSRPAPIWLSLDVETEGIIKTIKEFPDVGFLNCKSSPHVTIISNHQSDVALKELIKTCEGIYEDFKNTMYDPGLIGTNPLPNDEILRIYSFSRLNTFEAALKNAGALSNYGDITDKQELRWACNLGGYQLLSKRNGHPHLTYINCLKKGELNVAVNNRFVDINDLTAHQMAHALMASKMPKIFGYDLHIMPWLEEGFAVYTTLKHLGSKNYACFDFDLQGYAHLDTFKNKKIRIKYNDAETKVHLLALDKSANTFLTMIQITKYSNLKPPILSRAFSMIDFMIETDRKGFLMLIKKLQELTEILFMDKGAEAFKEKLDPLIAECFAQSNKAKKKHEMIDSLEALEKAWRKWVEITIKGNI